MSDGQRDSAVVHVACCPTHGLHGERTECFECGGPVEQVEMVPAGIAKAREDGLREEARRETDAQVRAMKKIAALEVELGKHGAVMVDNDDLVTVRDAMRSLNRMVDDLTSRRRDQFVLMKQGQMVALVIPFGKPWTTP